MGMLDRIRWRLALILGWRPESWTARLALLLGMVLLAVPVVVLCAVLWVLWIVVVGFLFLTRPLIYYPLMICLPMAALLTVGFAVMGDWAEAAETLFFTVVLGLVAAVYINVCERIDPHFFDSRPGPPWWWDRY